MNGGLQQQARIAAAINATLDLGNGMHAIGLQPSREEAQRQIALRLAAPKRADAGQFIADQHDASDCPLFRAADEPRLF